MDDVLSGANIDIYGLADATRRRANGLGGASRADGSVLSRSDLSTSVRARPDLKARRPFAELTYGTMTAYIELGIPRFAVPHKCHAQGVCRDVSHMQTMRAPLRFKW